MRCLAAKMRFSRVAAVMAALVFVFAQAACGSPKSTVSPAPTAAAGPAGDAFTIYFLNVGKGDAALLRLPGGRWAMVDTGPADAFAAVNGMLRLHGVKKLEAIFISHPHNDHDGNLEGVLGIASCPVVYTTPVDFGKPTEKLRETAAAVGAAVQALAPGQAVEIAGVSFTILGPNGTFNAEENDNSLVMMAQYNGFKVLFTGDQSLEAEAALIKTGRDVDCDVLKVGHHGVDDASSDAFIRAASPLYAIIPAAYGGEDGLSAAVMERLSKIGAFVSILGRTGSVLVASNQPEPQAVTPSAPPAPLIIRDVNVEAEFVEIVNPTSKAVDMTGWGLVSDKGNQFFAFPDGFILGNGESVKVYSGIEKDKMPAGNLYWTDKKIWHDKKADKASLCDPYGRTAASR